MNNFEMMPLQVPPRIYLLKLVVISRLKVKFQTSYNSTLLITIREAMLVNL